MTTKLLVAVVTAVLIVSACGDDDSADTTSTSPTGETSTSSAEATTTTDSVVTTTTIHRQPEAASSFFSIEEVVLGTNGYVAINNFTGVPVALVGLHLCQGPDCFELPDEVVDPGGTAYIAVGEAPQVDGVVVTGATIGELAPVDGEVALYVNDPDDPTQIVTYLEWGSTPHQRSPEATAKGLWPDGSFAPTGPNAVRLFETKTPAFGFGMLHRRPTGHQYLPPDLS